MNFVSFSNNETFRIRYRTNLRFGEYVAPVKREIYCRFEKHENRWFLLYSVCFCWESDRNQKELFCTVIVYCSSITPRAPHTLSPRSLRTVHHTFITLQYYYRWRVGERDFTYSVKRRRESRKSAKAPGLQVYLMRKNRIGFRFAYFFFLFKNQIRRVSRAGYAAWSIGIRRVSVTSPRGLDTRYDERRYSLCIMRTRELL